MWAGQKKKSRKGNSRAMVGRADVALHLTLHLRVTRFPAGLIPIPRPQLSCHLDQHRLACFLGELASLLFLFLSLKLFFYGSVAFLNLLKNLLVVIFLFFCQSSFPFFLFIFDLSD